MILFGAVFALVMNRIRHSRMASTDSIISVFSSVGVALGLVLLSRGGNVAKYQSLLVGDILSITPDELIQVRKGSRSIKPIPRLNLAAVIEARMTDIAEYVWNEIREAGFAKKLSAGIVLTGGTAALKNVGELFARVTGQETRVACAEIGIATESLEKAASPNYTLDISMLLRGAKMGACPVSILHTPAQAVEREPVVQQPAQGAHITPATPATPAEPAAAQPRTVNESYGAPAADENAAQSVTQRIATPTITSAPVNDGFEDDDEDEDVKSDEGIFGKLGKKIGRLFNEAFRNPDEDDDDEM
jgi:cell division ATPase FtsA